MGKSRHARSKTTIAGIGTENDEQEYGIFGPSSFSENDEVVLIPWNSQEGLERLIRSDYKQDFYQLAQYFQPQINPLYCGIATAVVILNSLRTPVGKVPSQKPLEVKKPDEMGGGVIPFHSYSQWYFLNEETDRIKPREIIHLLVSSESYMDADTQYDPGLSLNQLKGILEVYGAEVELHYADMDVMEGSQLFRETVKSILRKNNIFIVVNFVGNKIGAATGGHISPIGAYDERSEAVLILDVAGHKNPWYWAPIPHLYQSMHLKVGESYRGWLIVSDPTFDED